MRYQKEADRMTQEKLTFNWTEMSGRQKILTITIVLIFSYLMVTSYFNYKEDVINQRYQDICDHPAFYSCMELQQVMMACTPAYQEFIDDNCSMQNITMAWWWDWKQ